MALKDRYPILNNLFIGQVAFGIVATLLVTSLIAHYSGVRVLNNLGLGLRFLGLAVSVVVFGVYLQNIHRFGLVPDYSKQCRFCNGPVNRYSEFCEHCGADLIAEEKLVKCPGCSIDVYEDTAFCPECGTGVSSKRKSKKGGKKAKRAAQETDTASVGWSTPVDAVSGFPPDDER